MNVTQAPLNIEQAAAFFNFKTSYIYNLVHYGKLPAYKPSGKKLLFKISDLEKFAYGNKIGGHSERAEAILNTAQRKKTSKKVKVV